MPNPNAIVSTTVRLDPPLDRSPDELLHSERGLSVELEGGRRVRLDPANERSAGFARVSNVSGGIDAWSEEIDPSVPRY